MKWFKQWLCNHSWHHHWLHTPVNAMELRTCNKCNRSEVVKIIDQDFSNPYMKAKND